MQRRARPLQHRCKRLGCAWHGKLGMQPLRTQETRSCKAGYGRPTCPYICIGSAGSDHCIFFSSCPSLVPVTTVFAVLKAVLSADNNKQSQSMHYRGRQADAHDDGDEHAVLHVLPSTAAAEASTQRGVSTSATDAGGHMQHEADGSSSLLGQQSKQPPPPTRPNHQGTGNRLPLALALAYLCTGTALAVMGQMVVQQGAAATEAHLPAFTKYISSFALSLGLHGIGSLTAQPSSGGGTKATGRRATAVRLTWAVG